MLSKGDTNTESIEGIIDLLHSTEDLIDISNVRGKRFHSNLQRFHLTPISNGSITIEQELRGQEILYRRRSARDADIHLDTCYSGNSSDAAWETPAGLDNTSTQ